MTCDVPSGAAPSMSVAKGSRRDFILLAAGAVASVMLADCGGSSSTPSKSGNSSKPISEPTSATYHSRPDLEPPLVTIRRGTGTPAPGLVCVTPAGPLLVDDKGEPVWIHRVPHAATNLRVQQYQGRKVLTWWQGEVAHYGVGLQGEYVILDESYHLVATVKAHNGLAADLHEFIIDGSGVAYFTAYRHYTADLRSVGGPKEGPALDATIQGVDLATGTLVFEWRSADHISFEESKTKYVHGAPYDPVHLNSVDFTPDGKLLFSARNTWCIYKVEPSSGDIVWRLGGTKSDFDLGPGVRFVWQHDARTHADGTISVFDDEGDPPEARQSRGLVIAVDETTMKATEVGQYAHPDKSLLAGSQGSVQLLPGGNVFVGWGAEPTTPSSKRTARSWSTPDFRLAPRTAPFASSGSGRRPSFPRSR